MYLPLLQKVRPTQNFNNTEIGDFVKAYEQIEVKSKL